MRQSRSAWLPALFALASAMIVAPAAADVVTPVPEDERGYIDAERRGFHDANGIRTEFWNYGMVGNYPPDPGNVDLSTFHSVEVPKGSGMNYSDGITPFVLAKITTSSGSDVYVMETGFRERQGISPYHNRVMRFEPRPGYFQDDPGINVGRSPAVSNDPRTWPGSWPDRFDESDDPGWPGSWNGYFGKQIVADQESYSVMDDDFYDAWQFYPDSRDSTRRGLGLRIEVRGFQWSNPQARNVVFWHYDITNEGTTDYDDNILFGVYMDSGVGGSSLSCDGIFESDDDNAFFDRSFNEDVLNLVYTWDRFGHGKDLASSCARTGYLGYAYLETPGNATDGIDNDEDGVIDEMRDGGAGFLLEDAAEIEAYVAAHYDLGRFEATYGSLADLPAYREEYWWTGDEDMDWTRDQHDTGADGVFETADAGEGDGMPTAGEPNFDRTDLHESDQIGLTGFKINRIRPGLGNPEQDVDGIVFYTDESNWPQRLYEQFTDPDPEQRFDPPLASNYNIAFLFASGPFRLAAGQKERFSLALAYGADLDELRRTVKTVQQIYDANYRFAVPPSAPTVSAEAGDGYVRLSWDDVAEFSADPVTGIFDFEGYRVYRSTDPEFRDPQVISTGTGTGPIGNGKPIAQFDLVDERSGFSDQVVEGVAYYLGTESGITHTWTDNSVTNGQQYYYAVTAYDYGSDPDDRFNFYPSENAITPSRTPRGGLILPPNVVSVRPNPRVLGYVPAQADQAVKTSGRGIGEVGVAVINSGIIPDGHLMKIDFSAPSPDSLRATRYSLRDSTTGELFFETGADLSGEGVGPVGQGLLPVITTQLAVAVDSTSGFDASSGTDAVLIASYQPALTINRLRPGFPDDISIIFANTVQDTGLNVFPYSAKPANFQVIAHSGEGDRRLDFRFRDIDNDGTLSHPNDALDIVTYLPESPDTIRSTWLLKLDPAAAAPAGPPAEGDSYRLRLTRPFAEDDSFVFTTAGESIDESRIEREFSPYVVPNPYVGSASFEPERFAVSGRGERRIEFRGLPGSCVIRIYNVRGELIQTLRHDGSNDGYVAWNLRTKEGLDVAPGLYIFQVAGGAAGSKTGKFAIIK